NALGVLCSDLGEYQQSLDYYFQSLPLRKQVGKAEYADTILNIAIALRHFGEPHESKKYFDYLRPVYEEIGETQGDWSGLGDLLQNIGNFYLDADKYQDAVDFYKESIRLHQNGGEKRSEGIAWDSLGLAYKGLGDYNSALDAHTHAHDLYKDITDLEGIGVTYTNEGALFEDLGRYQQGIEAYSKSLEISAITRSAEDRGFALYGLGRIYQKMHQTSKALSCFREVAKMLEELRGTIAVTEARQGFSASKNPVYYSMVSALAEEGRLNEAFDISEKYRVRAMREVLVNKTSDLKRIVSPELYEQKAELERKLSELEREISSTGRDLVQPGLWPEMKRSLLGKIKDATAQHDLLGLDDLELEVRLSR